MNNYVVSPSLQDIFSYYCLRLTPKSRTHKVRTYLSLILIIIIIIIIII
jgi:hypothetical protein